MNEIDSGRRKFLIATVRVGAIAIFAPTALAQLVESATTAESSAAVLRALVPHHDAAAALGRAYLAANPDEARDAVLVHLLLGDAGGTPIAKADATGRIAAGISADFSGGRTVVVDRWILSRTEARLFGLVALA